MNFVTRFPSDSTDCVDVVLVVELPIYACGRRLVVKGIDEFVKVSPFSPP
jgi:hypothetical protein